MNSQSTYISEQIRDASGEYINPSTIEGQEKILEAIDWISLTSFPLIQWENGELITKDIWIEKLFWNNPLIRNGWIISSVINDTKISNGKIGWLNSEIRTDTTQYSTCSIQLSWVWAWTVVFEASSNWGDFVALAWINIATNSLLTSVTGNGIFKFNISWLTLIRVRLSAYTSWAVFVNFVLSSWEQNQPLSQRATTFELNTFDTNLQTLPTAIGTTQMYQTGFELEWIRQFAPTVNPTQPTAYVEPKFANYPQRFRRLRVEAGGSERLPFAQEPNTNRMVVSTPDLYRIQEEQLLVLMDIRDLLKISLGVYTTQ